MANPPTPISVSDMDPNFELRIRDAQTHAESEYNARSLGNQVLWFRPEGWNGKVFDYNGMSIPFSRSVSNQYYLDAVQDPDNAPGTTGDIVVTTTQIDYLAMMERAFRVRQTLRRPRGMAHLLSRKLGQGNPQGPLIQNLVEYVRSLLQQAKVK